MPSHSRSDPGHGSGPPKYPGTFLLAFREAVAARGWRIDRWLGAAVACVDGEGHEHLVGLENLYRRARREDRQQFGGHPREERMRRDLGGEPAQGIPAGRRGGLCRVGRVHVQPLPARGAAGFARIGETAHSVVPRDGTRPGMPGLASPPGPCRR